MCHVFLLTIEMQTIQKHIQPISEKKTELANKRWFMIALVTAVWHILLFWMKPDFLKPAPPAPVEIVNIDPQKLQAIQNQWKQKKLLLNTDTTPKKDIAPPKNAEYESDRNRVVEKEMRARQTQVIPQKGSNQLGETEVTAPAIPMQSIPLKNLSNLDLNKIMAKPAPRPMPQRPRGSTQLGGDQALMDKNLPEGAENILNTQESVHYAFYSRIAEAIAPLWLSKLKEALRVTSLKPSEYLTRIEVIFDSDGNFVDYNILDSSGVQSLDHAVIAGWKKIPRFPNPPRALLDKNGYIRMAWAFGFDVSEKQGIQFAPPERYY